MVQERTYKPQADVLTGEHHKLFIVMHIKALCKK